MVTLTQGMKTMKKILLLCAMVTLGLGAFLAASTHVLGGGIVRVANSPIVKTSALPYASDAYLQGLPLNLPTAPIPESAKMLLFGFILVGIGIIANRKRAK